MSALGRISGPLLKSNLIRNGIDLAFETDLLYLDVNNQRIGVKTATPTHELQVNGTTRTVDLTVTNRADIADVNIVGNTISSDNQYLNLGTFDNVVYNNKLRIDDIDIEGNVISTNTSNSNLEFRPNGTGEVHVYSNMEVDGNIHATGNISADGNIVLGDADTDNIVINADIASNIIPDVDNTYTLGTGGTQYTLNTDFNYGDTTLSITSGAGTLSVPASGTAWADDIVTNYANSGDEFLLAVRGTSGTLHEVTLTGSWTGTDPRQVTVSAPSILDGTYDVVQYNLDARRWSDVWVDNILTNGINTGTIVVDGINLTLRQGNIYYVAENGDDLHTGTHQQDPFATVEQALSVAISGDTVHIYPGVYTETFPLTVPVGVTVKGESMRSVKIVPTTNTRYNDAFLINGESTVIDLTIADFYSGGNFFEVTAAGSSPIWIEQQKITASDAFTDDRFGLSVAISGDTAIVGAYQDDDDGSASGSAYIYTRSGGVWTEQQKITASDGNTSDWFGFSVAISGDTAIVGAYQDDDDGFTSGSAYIYTRSGGVWTEQQKITASDAFTDDRFGYSVAISGDTAIVGAYRNDDDGFSSGSAYIYTRSGGVWTEQQKITASDGNSGDLFGFSVAISGDTAIVGAYGNDADGSAYVFTRSGSTWTEQQKITASDGDSGDLFGLSVAISGDTAIVGAYADDDDGNASGSAYVFTRSGSTWTEQQKITASDANTDDFFGRSVAISGDTAIVGAYQDDDDGSASGSAYIYTRSGGVWTEQQKITASDGNTSDRFGFSVAISGNTAIVGAYADDDDGSAYFLNKPGGTSSTTVNVGTAPQAHAYVSGGTITIDDVEYPITGADYNKTTGVLEVYHTGGLSTVGDDVFLSGIGFSCEGGSKTYPNNGYAFRFATDFEVTSRSPYIKNISVITKGSTTTAEDPRGFNAGDAGKGAYIDGSYATANSKEAAMLFHSATFITPGVDAITMTNGVRVEWLNSFTYFANRSMYAYDSPLGLKSDGKTRIRLSGLGGTAPAAGQTVTFTSTDSSTVVGPLNIESVENSDTLVIDGKNTDLLGFDTTPDSINFSAGGSATTIENVDVRDFGAEVRLIGSASVYGNEGLVGDGEGVLMYAIGHNLAYIGNGKEVTNDPNTVIQANEVIETNNAQIRYNSVDHKGDFRVGDLFYVNQETGSASFSVSDFIINTTGGVTFTTGGDTTFVDGTKVETGDWRFSGNTVETLTQDANFTAASGTINLQDNTNITGNLDVTGNVTIGGNITIGDEATDTIQIVAGIDSDIIPRLDSTYSLGTATKTWSNLYANQVNVDDVEIHDNYITSTTSNADLELRANGTGEILVPSNDVTVEQDLTVNGTATLANTSITGTVTIVGDVSQTGSYTLTEDLTVGQNLTVGAAAQFEEILIDDNFITTTTSNTDLELRANGTGNIVIPNNDVNISNDLAVTGDISANNLTVTANITANDANIGNVQISGTAVEATASNADLELRANGTGIISVPASDVEFGQALTVQGATDLQDTTVTGTFTHVGDTDQTGNYTITGQFSNGDILVDGNTVSTTLSNSDLELRANGAGIISIPTNNVAITNDLDVDGVTNLDVTNIDGTLTHVGDTTQTGNYTITGQFSNGDILINGNTIETTDTNSDLELRANGAGIISVPNNDVTFSQALTVSGATDLQNTTITGTITHVGNVVQTGNLDIAGEISNGNILIEDNFIATTNSNSDLELRASGTGEILIPNNDVRITNNLFVNGDATLGDTTLTGNVNITGDVTQSGDYSITSDLTVGGNLTVTRSAQFEEILIDDNFVTTTTSNTDLELRANGTGEILVPNNDVHITNDLTVDGTITVGDINSAGTITANRFSNGDILIDDNFITTTLSNSDLELRANGTGDVIVPGNDVTVEQDLTVNGTTALANTSVTGTITHTGDATQTGDFNLTGDLIVTGNINSSLIQLENIQLVGNVVETTLSNSDLELRANGTGDILIPNNDVDISGNLTVDGALTVGNVVSTATIQANKFTTGDILVDDNFITTTVSNSDLELRASGTGSIVIDDFNIKDNTINSTGNMTFVPGGGAVIIDATGSLKLPTGDTGERPLTPEAGQIRYNSEINRFEGYNGTNWVNLKGVEDLDGDTRVTAELTEGADDDTIRFYAGGTLVVDIDQNRLNALRVIVDDITVDGNVINTITADTDLVLTANGTGSVVFENFAFKDNTITNTVADSVTTFKATDNGYVKFDGTYGFVIPAGGNIQRPPLANTELGQMRWNTDAQRTEIYDGSNWVSVAGTQSGITRSEAEELALEIVLSLG